MSAGRGRAVHWRFGRTPFGGSSTPCRWTGGWAGWSKAFAFRRYGASRTFRSTGSYGRPYHGSGWSCTTPYTRRATTTGLAIGGRPTGTTYCGRTFAGTRFTSGATGPTLGGGTRRGGSASLGSTSCRNGGSGSARGASSCGTCAPNGAAGPRGAVGTGGAMSQARPGGR